ncbi:Hypothetical protein CpATCC19410_0664 [Corynebacterium pseudotuberculosis]|nr:Hypothetical protein CpATCC19410_0664 [Corynebacterium pseudotuberculosis]
MYHKGSWICYGLCRQLDNPIEKSHVQRLQERIGSGRH